MNIICFTGGTCGDILTVMIDSTEVDLSHTWLGLSAERCRLKKPHTFCNDLEKNLYLDQVSLLYNSIPSHDLDYHVRQRHNFISITVKDFGVALWASTRFKEIHRPHVWEEMQRVCGATTIEEYAQRIIDYSNMVQQHTDCIVTLERILSGHAIEDLSQWIKTDLNIDIYKRWLQQHQYTG
jgi:hypothetical protein